ncbi:MAG: restriction endonuclease subunit S [Oscillibacter sp.]|nr:restriction endonuclease subunit S [Oscillibacter sp.]
MDRIRLGDACEILNGYAFRSENYVESGIRVIRISNVQKGYIEDNTPAYYPLDSNGLDRFMLEEGDLLMSLTGNVGRVAILEKKFLPAALNQRVACLRLKSDKLSKRYLFHILNSDFFEQQCILSSKGVAQKNMSTEWLKDFEIPLYPTEKQEEITDILDKTHNVIACRIQELQKLDELVKARFVELFGDPISNSFGLHSKPMTDICEIIDGDRGKNYPTTDDFSDDGYCLFLNAKNVTSDGFNFENCMYITEEKDAALRKGRLKRGDVVLTTRGTIGNLAFYTNEIPFEHVRINSGMVILRMKQDVADEVYFIEHFKMQLADIKAKIASGSAQPQLPISTMNKIQILIPEIEQQREFAAFVDQTNKSKMTIQKSLDKLETLKKALMQKYFG